MRILEIILPVLVMLVLGMACRKLKLLTKSGIDNMKLLVTNIMLQVAIFHALAQRITVWRPGNWWGLCSLCWWYLSE